MARPTFTGIVSGIEGWDGDVNDNFEIFSLGPWPVYEHSGDESDIATSFTPALYDRCFAMVNHTVHGWSLYVCDGTSWLRVFNLTQPTLTALTDNSGGTANDTVQALTDPADTPATADALRDDLVANLIPELRNNIADLTAKLNAVRTILVDHGLAS